MAQTEVEASLQEARDILNTIPEDAELPAEVYIKVPVGSLLHLIWGGVAAVDVVGSLSGHPQGAAASQAIRDSAQRVLLPVAEELVRHYKATRGIL